MEKYEQFLVPAGRASETVVEKKSRFIGQITPAETEQEALAFIRHARETYWDATHNVYAYIIKDGPTRYSDDGEPGGTAGMPVLNVLRQQEIYNVCCVVTRYFGGTLLGAGGLVRAYSKTAKAALDAAGVSMKRLWDVIRIPCPYALYERARQQIIACGGVVEQAEFGAQVELLALIPAERTEQFSARWSDLSNGQVQIQIDRQVYRA